MTGKYTDYFNDLRQIDEKVDKHFDGNNDKRQRLYSNYISSHPNFLHLDNNIKNKSIKINNIAGALEMLNTPTPLPINHYTAKKINYDMQGVHTSGYKNLHYDIEENEVVHNKIIDTLAGGDKKANPSIKPHSHKNLPRKKVYPAVGESKAILPKVKSLSSDPKSVNLLDNLVNSGLATIDRPNNKVPQTISREDNDRKKTKDLIKRMNTPLVSKPKQTPIRLGFNTPDTGRSSTI